MAGHEHAAGQEHASEQEHAAGQEHADKADQSPELVDGVDKNHENTDGRTLSPRSTLMESERQLASVVAKAVADSKCDEPSEQQDKIIETTDKADDVCEMSSSKDGEKVTENNSSSIEDNESVKKSVSPKDDSDKQHENVEDLGGMSDGDNEEDDCEVIRVERGSSRERTQAISSGADSGVHIPILASLVAPPAGMMIDVPSSNLNEEVGFDSVPMDMMSAQHPQDVLTDEMMVAPPEVRHQVSQKKTRAGESVYRCSLCSYSTKDPWHLDKHYLAHTRDYKTCRFCKKAFERPSDLVRHEERHKQKAARIGYLGPLTTGEKGEVDRANMLASGMIEGDDFDQAMIATAMANRAELATAMARKPVISPDNISTGPDPDIDQSPTGLMQVDNENGPFNMETDPHSAFAELPYAQTPYKVQKTGSGANPSETRTKLRFFYCDECSFRFISPLTLRNHKRSVHDSDLALAPLSQPSPTTVHYFYCDQCSARFMSIQSVKKHKEQMHETLVIRLDTYKKSILMDTDLYVMEVGGDNEIVLLNQKLGDVDNGPSYTTVPAVSNLSDIRVVLLQIKNAKEKPRIQLKVGIQNKYGVDKSPVQQQETRIPQLTPEPPFRHNYAMQTKRLMLRSPNGVSPPPRPDAVAEQITNPVLGSISVTPFSTTLDSATPPSTTNSQGTPTSLGMVQQTFNSMPFGALDPATNANSLIEQNSITATSINSPLIMVDKECVPGLNTMPVGALGPPGNTDVRSASRAVIPGIGTAVVRPILESGSLGPSHSAGVQPGSVESAQSQAATSGHGRILGMQPAMGGSVPVSGHPLFANWQVENGGNKHYLGAVVRNAMVRRPPRKKPGMGHFPNPHVSVNYRYKCKQCTYGTNLPQKMYEHQQAHRGRYICKLCKKAFIKTSDLTRHWLTHNIAKENGLLPCDSCDFVTPIPQELEVHMKIHYNRNTKFGSHGRHINYSDIVDAGSEAFYTGLANPAVKIEPVNTQATIADSQQGNPLTDDQIPTLKGGVNLHEVMNFDSGSYVQAEQVVTGDKVYNEYLHPDLSFYCPECSVGFVTNIGLTRHRQIKHKVNTKGNKYRIGTRDNSYACKYCSKVFTHLASYFKHEKLHKTSHKTNACPYCAKRFTTIYYLRDHIRLHTGEKPFECEKCGERFSLKPNLYMHKKKNCRTSSRGKVKLLSELNMPLDKPESQTPSFSTFVIEMDNAEDVGSGTHDSSQDVGGGKHDSSQDVGGGEHDSSQDVGGGKHDSSQVDKVDYGSDDDTIIDNVEDVNMADVEAEDGDEQKDKACVGNDSAVDGDREQGALAVDDTQKVSGAQKQIECRNSEKMERNNQNTEVNTGTESLHKENKDKAENINLEENQKDGEVRVENSSIKESSGIVEQYRQSQTVNTIQQPMEEEAETNKDILNNTDLKKALHTDEENKNLCVIIPDKQLSSSVGDTGDCHVNTKATVGTGERAVVTEITNTGECVVMENIADTGDCVVTAKTTNDNRTFNDALKSVDTDKKAASQEHLPTSTPSDGHGDALATVIINEDQQHQEGDLAKESALDTLIDEEHLLDISVEEDNLQDTSMEEEERLLGTSIGEQPPVLEHMLKEKGTTDKHNSDEQMPQTESIPEKRRRLSSTTVGHYGAGTRPTEITTTTGESVESLETIQRVSLENEAQSQRRSTRASSGSKDASKTGGVVETAGRKRTVMDR